MTIYIEDTKKDDVVRALRVAIGKINQSMATAFNTCHPDRYNMNWYKWVEKEISAMKELKQLLDILEEPKQSTKGERK